MLDAIVTTQAAGSIEGTRKNRQSFFFSELYINFRNENANNQIDGYNDGPQMKQISNSE